MASLSLLGTVNYSMTHVALVGPVRAAVLCSTPVIQDHSSSSRLSAPVSACLYRLPALLVSLHYRCTSDECRLVAAPVTDM